jgi:hypothetical protein
VKPNTDARLGQTRTSSRNSAERHPDVEGQPVSPSKSESQTYTATNSAPEQLEALVGDIAPEQTHQAIPEEFYEEPICQADPYSNMAVENFISELFANSELREINSNQTNTNQPSSGQDFCLLDNQAPQHDVLELTHRDTSGMNATHGGTYMPFTIAPSQTRLIVPPGLLPKSPEISHQVPNVGQSMFSEHIEALETQCRYKLDMAPDELSRQMYVIY